ncbi:hypothetical protein IGJ02_000395 [Enterococcus sp. DIV0724b]|uniref:SMEK domain-containing protein n=1 Tax=Enterococcus sp. DIV0724b TaxID=2774694 RepID=UPI003D2FB89D
MKILLKKSIFRFIDNLFLLEILEGRKKILMRRHNNFDDFSERLVILNRKIELRGKLNLNDLSVHSEDFFLNLFNQLLGLNLLNLNTVKKNAEAIDLLDSENKKIIQVSATCTKQKVENTLKKADVKSYADQDYRVQFIFVGAQDNKIKSRKFSNPFQIQFNPQTDIFLTEDILRLFNTLDILRQDAIIELVNLELPQLELLDNQKLKKNVCVEISQILSENKLIWENFGPNSKMATINPLERTTFNIWKCRKQEIFDNNNKILNLFYEHESIFTLEERQVFTEFKEHVFSFETNNITRLDNTVYKIFPQHFPKLIDTIIRKEE